MAVIPKDLRHHHPTNIHLRQWLSYFQTNEFWTNDLDPRRLMISVSIATLM